MRQILLSILFAVPFTLLASNLKIDAVEWHHETSPHKKAHVKMTISWENAWHNDRNYDAAWVHIKFKHKDWGTRHAKLSKTGHRILANNNSGSPAPKITVPSDGTGFFIFPEKNYRGDVNWTVQIALDTSILTARNFRAGNHRIRVYGVEMVYIPSGAFMLGDPDTLLLNEGALFKSAGDSKFDGLYKIENEKSEIKIGKENGQLYYRARDSVYQGDQKGIITSVFPKGVQAFYMMKYELCQGQYAGFLNSLSDGQSHHRANFGGKNYYKLRGTIYFEKGHYIAGSKNRPCNYLSWDDATAYADWAALRPMTEFEFTKACRGQKQPAFHERPWGKESKEKIARYVNEDGNLTLAGDMDESQLNNENQEVFCASHFWVMDLAGSLWERVITIGDPKGRAFKGTHGDGRISSYGFANVPDWPQGISETGGFGFRGGGFYEHGRMYHDFNPHSPIAHRRFGSWSGGNRTEAYGSRFVRTAE